MNFKIIEGDYIDFDNIYEDFTHDYLYNNQLDIQDIRRKYGLTYNELRYISKMVRDEFNLTRRPAIHRGAMKKNNCRYYYCVNGYYRVIKKIEGKFRYLGSFKSEKIAQQMVELYKSFDWDYEKCLHIARNWRDYIC